MMKTSTRLLATGVAGLLGVALAAGVTTAASALTAADVPGQVLQVSGVGPASAQATDPAKGPSGVTAVPATTAAPTAPATMPTSVRQVSRPAPRMLPGYHEDMSSRETAHSWTGVSASSGTMR